MKFLANENYPKPSVEYLKRQGYQVKSIQEELGGISDEEVVAIAQKEKLVILTFDSDYGELLFKYQKTKPPATATKSNAASSTDAIGSQMLTTEFVSTASRNCVYALAIRAK